MSLPAAPPNEIEPIHVYKLVSDTCGHEYHALCYPRIGSRPIVTYGDDVEKVVKAAQQILDAPKKFCIKA